MITVCDLILSLTHRSYRSCTSTLSKMESHLKDLSEKPERGSMHAWYPDVKEEDLPEEIADGELSGRNAKSWASSKKVNKLEIK